MKKSLSVNFHQQKSYWKREDIEQQEQQIASVSRAKETLFIKS